MAPGDRDTGSKPNYKQRRMLALSGLLATVLVIGLAIAAITSGNDGSSPEQKAEAQRAKAAAAVKAKAVAKAKKAAAQQRCVADNRGLVRNGSRKKRVVALTFDDGPDQMTDKFLDVLKKEKVKATFFVIGRQVRTHKPQLQRIVREGHAVGNHSFSHADLSKDRKLAEGELEYTNLLIKETIGFNPCMFRPPMGLDSPMLLEVAKKNGLIPVEWDVDAGDYQLPGAAVIAQESIANAHNGAIILLHDGGGDRSQSLAAAQVIIDSLKQQGYKFVTVPELLQLPIQKPEEKLSASGSANAAKS